MLTLSFGCGEGTEGDTGYSAPEQMQTTDGTCNAIAARAMRTGQQCFRSGRCEPGSAECDVALSVLGELFGDEYCAPAILNDELNGFPTGNPIAMPDGSSRTPFAAFPANAESARHGSGIANENQAPTWHI